MSNDIDRIVRECFRELARASELGAVTPGAEAVLYEYVRYWMALGAPRDRVLARCEGLIKRATERVRPEDVSASDGEKLCRELVERCVHHYAGLSTLRQVD
ncbi:MAG: hypothetical protein HOQ09_06035 [Gemmatimonadaceae bacterium]|nr:hypothetical protein [Gemmatimonadaceae bacterium]